MHVVRLLDAQDRACLEVHVPKDKLQESVELFLRLYPGKRIWVDGTIVQLGGDSVPAAGSSSAGVPDARPAEPTLAPMEAILKLGSMMFAEHLECQRRLTEEMMQQYSKVRTSLEEIDLMTRGARVIEFQEYVRGLQAMNAGPRGVDGEERRRSWRNEQFERFVIGGLKATKIVGDA